MRLGILDFLKAGKRRFSMHLPAERNPSELLPKNRNS